MSKFEIPPEYLPNFDVSEGFRVTEPMDITEEPEPDLFDTIDSEWIQWHPDTGEIRQTEEAGQAEENQPLKQIMTFGQFLNYHREFSTNDPSNSSAMVDSSSKREPKKKKKEPATKRGTYRTYTRFQVQELLDLVLWQGMTASKAGILTGIVVRTAQHYVKTYREDQQKRLPGIKNSFKAVIIENLHRNTQNF